MTSRSKLFTFRLRSDSEFTIHVEGEDIDDAMIKLERQVELEGMYPSWNLDNPELISFYNLENEYVKDDK